MSLFRALLFCFPSVAFRLSARDVLARRVSPDGANRIWAETLARQAQLRRVRPHHSLGVAFLIRYMEWDAALYQSAQAHGLSKPEAGRLVEEANWEAFGPISTLSFRLSRLRSSHPLQRVRWLLAVMFKVLFTAPFSRKVYPSDDQIAFDVTECPLAKYFRDRGVPELTQHAACSLDYRLSVLWGLNFKRSKTIAEGYPLCDFRFRTSGGDVAPPTLAGDAAASRRPP